MATRDDPSLEILRTFLLFAEHHGPGEVARQIDRDPAVVSRRLAVRFANFDIGDKFKTGNKELTVVGWLDGGTSAFEPTPEWQDLAANYAAPRGIAVQSLRIAGVDLRTARGGGVHRAVVRSRMVVVRNNLRTCGIADVL